MCLNICDYSEIFVLDKPMVVYKHIVYNIAKDGFLTPYQLSPVEFGKLIRSDIYIPDYASQSYYNFSATRGIHSYIDKDDAERAAMFYREILVRCTIPKRSICITGKFDNMKTIVSNAIIYDSIINAQYYTKIITKQCYEVSNNTNDYSITNCVKKKIEHLHDIVIKQKKNHMMPLWTKAILK